MLKISNVDDSLTLQSLATASLSQPIRPKIYDNHPVSRAATWTPSNRLLALTPPILEGEKRRQVAALSAKVYLILVTKEFWQKNMNKLHLVSLTIK